MSFCSSQCSGTRCERKQRKFLNFKFCALRKRKARKFPPFPSDSFRCVTIWLWSFSFFFPSSVKPIAVHITTREKFVSAEKRYDVECKSSGSRPEAVLTWWKGSRQIKRMAKNVSIDTKPVKMFSFTAFCSRKATKGGTEMFAVILMMFVWRCLNWWVNRQLWSEPAISYFAR